MQLNNTLETKPIQYEPHLSQTLATICSYFVEILMECKYIFVLSFGKSLKAKLWFINNCVIKSIR